MPGPLDISELPNDQPKLLITHFRETASASQLKWMQYEVNKIALFFGSIGSGIPLTVGNVHV